MKSRFSRFLSLFLTVVLLTGTAATAFGEAEFDAPAEPAEVTETPAAAALLDDGPTVKTAADDKVIGTDVPPASAEAAAQEDDLPMDAIALEAEDVVLPGEEALEWEDSALVARQDSGPIGLNSPVNSTSEEERSFWFATSFPLTVKVQFTTDYNSAFYVYEGSNDEPLYHEMVETEKGHQVTREKIFTLRPYGGLIIRVPYNVNPETQQFAAYQIRLLLMPSAAVWFTKHDHVEGAPNTPSTLPGRCAAALPFPPTASSCKNTRRSIPPLRPTEAG